MIRATIVIEIGEGKYEEHTKGFTWFGNVHIYTKTTAQNFTITKIRLYMRVFILIVYMTKL